MGSSPGFCPCPSPLRVTAWPPGPSPPLEPQLTADAGLGEPPRSRGRSLLGTLGTCLPSSREQLFSSCVFPTGRQTVLGFSEAPCGQQSLAGLCPDRLCDLEQVAGSQWALTASVFSHKPYSGFAGGKVRNTLHELSGTALGICPRTHGLDKETVSGLSFQTSASRWRFLTWSPGMACGVLVRFAEFSRRCLFLGRECRAFQQALKEQQHKTHTSFYMSKKLLRAMAWALGSRPGAHLPGNPPQPGRERRLQAFQDNSHAGWRDRWVPTQPEHG